MKKTGLLLFTLMPFFALGQNNSVIHFDNYEQLMETTLINDTKFYQPNVKLEVVKSQDHSLTLKKRQPTNYIDEQKLEKLLLEVKPLMDSKLQLKKPKQ